MAATTIYLSDGNKVWLPVDPRTWVDAGPGVAGDALRAPLVTQDAGGAVALHRQRPLFQGAAFSALSIPSNTFTAITGLSELIDNYGGHSDTSNTGRYFAPATSANTSGGDWYLCTGYVPFSSASATSVFIAGLRTNGGGTVQEGGRLSSGTGHVVDTMVVDLVQLNGLNSGDYVELVGWQNTGSAVNTVVSGKTPSLTVRWVAPDQSWSGIHTPALPAVPHTWTGTDEITASLTGVGKVPLNTELRDLARFLNNPPIARVTASGTSQTVPTGSGTWTSVNFTSGSNVDTYGGWASGNPSRYTCQRAGLYLIAGFGNVIEPATPAGYRAVRLLQTKAAGGTQAYAGWSAAPQVTGGSSAGTGLYACGLVRMAVGDYVEVQMQQTQGSALTLFNAAGNAPRLVAVWMAL